jgi:hypothetical protein
MVRRTPYVIRIGLPLVFGLGAICGLLLVLHGAAVASPQAEQPAGAFVLWLVPPEVSSWPRPWPALVEVQQAGWTARSGTVRERLAALKEQGRIDTFGPLPGEVGFTITALAGLPPEVARWPEVARVTAPAEATEEALDAWWRQGLEVIDLERTAPLRVDQVTTLTLNLGLHSWLVSGATPRPEPILLSLTRDDLVLASIVATPFPDGSGGYFYATALHGGYPLYGEGGGGGGYLAIEPGDVLLAVQAGRTVSLTVPVLTALADRDTATVYGQSSPSTTLEVYLYRYDDPGVAYQRLVTTSADGDYTVDFSALTLVEPRDYGYVFSIHGAGNCVYARYNVPFLRVQIGGQYAGGHMAPCAALTATLYDHAGAVRDLYHGVSSAEGTFEVYLYPAPQVSDTLVVTAAEQVVSMTVPLLTAHPDPASDVIAGLAPPGTAVELGLYRGPLWQGASPCPPWDDADYSLSVTATLTGTLAGSYVADFSGIADVAAGDYGVVSWTDPSGYLASRCWIAPFLQLRLDDYRLRGQVSGGGPLTITIWSASGIPRDVHFTSASDNGYFYDYGSGGALRLMTGDQVTVTAHDGQEIGMTMPTLTAKAETTNSTVTGQAPPGSLLRVGLHSGWYPDAGGGGGPSDPGDYEYTLWVTSTASGVYTADFSSLTTIRPGDYGAVFHVGPGGHEAYVEYRALAWPALYVQIGGNIIEGTLPIEEGHVIITLRDASGQAKATAHTWAYYQGSFNVTLFHENGQPAFIEAGDTVEVAAEVPLAIQNPTPTPTPYPTSKARETLADDTIIVFTVPTLTVECDRRTDALSGQAPPNAPLEVTWTGNDGWDGGSHSWIITSTLAGSYSLDLSNQADLDRGDRVKVTWTDDEGNQVWLAHRTPGLDAALGNASIQVFGPALRPVTLTLLSTSGTPIYTDTFTFGSSGQAWCSPYEQPSYFPLFLEAGQTIIARLESEMMTVTLPRLTALIDAQTNVVSGEAPPGSRLMISPHDYSYLTEYRPITVTVTGTYSVDLGDGAANGEVIYLHPDGHRVTLDFFVPHIEVTLGTPYVYGVGPGPGVLTVTLRGADGELKGSGADKYRWDPDTFYVKLADAQQQPVMVSGGDVLFVEAAGSVMSVTVPVLTASFDQRTGILTGVAPAGAWLRIHVDYNYRQVQASPDGTYAMDWSDLSPSSGTQGNVRITDDRGNRINLDFTVPYYGVYLPLITKGL